jgi:hypothetical protein
MGSDTLSGTPAGDLKATLTPVLYNGVYYICGGTYTNKAANFACTFFYNFINTTGSDFSGATMSVSFDNYGYIVLNGVKYPSTNPNMSLGYEGIGGVFDQSLTNFTVTIPKGLNTIELRCVNMSTTPGLNVWESQGIGVQPNNPSAAWLRITSSTSTVLIKTDATWNCRQFDYPAKFVRPFSLGDVGENAGLSRPYSLAALAGKVMYDNSKNATTLTSPVSLYTADSKTFVYPSWTSTQFNSAQNGNHYAWNVSVQTVNGTYSCRAVASGNASKYMTWTCTVSGGSVSVSGFSLVNVDNGGSPRIGWTTSFASGVGTFNDFPYNGGGVVYFIVDFWYRYADATYILTVTRTS